MKPEKKTKRIDIRVKVTYEACMECNVSTDIAEALEHVQDNFPCEITTYNTCNDDKAAKALEWIADNIKEKDSCDWEAEIEDLSIMETSTPSE
ncbi:MAG: hypothetical protein IJ504_00845 [Bacteroidales bacterium]|nr:hypothetical protein [Bacteroidales bacterium]